MQSNYVDLTAFNIRPITVAIKTAETRGFMVLPWRRTKQRETVEYAWLRNRCERNKPATVVFATVGGRGIISVTGEPFGKDVGLVIDDRELTKSLITLYESFPKEQHRKMKLRKDDIRSMCSKNNVWAHFPPGDISIIECILRQVGDGLEGAHGS